MTDVTTNTELAVPGNNEPIQPDELLSAEDAKQLTSDILQGVHNVNGLLIEAYQRRAWSALGYDTWDAYVDSEFQGAPLALPREKRQEAVASLKKAGLSLRAIASATGTSVGTVHGDLAAANEAAGVQELNTSNLTEEQHVRLDELTEKETSDDDFLSDEEHAELKELREITVIDAEVVDEPEAAPTKGLDGKTYKQPEAKTPKPVATPRVPAILKQAKKLATAIQRVQEAANELITDVDYINADKELRRQMDEALAIPLRDLTEEFDLKLTAKWSKLAG